MTYEEAARILDPETSREALLPYAYDPQYQQMLLRKACVIAANVLENYAALTVSCPEGDLTLPDGETLKIKILGLPRVSYEPLRPADVMPVNCIKIQYNGEELTVQELCTRLKLAECRAITAENDKASLLQDKRSTDLYIRDKDSGRIHRVGDECHDALWVDTDGTVYYSNLQNGDGCSHHSRTDKNAGYEFMPSDFGELMVCQVAGEE